MINAATGAAGTSGNCKETFSCKIGKMPTTKPIAQAIQPAGLKPARGPLHLQPLSRYSTSIAPKMGPKEAPMILKTMMAWPAKPVMARTMLTAAPMPTEMNGFTPDSVVLKLLAAMNEEKHADGNAEMASRNMISPAALLPISTGIRPGVWRIKPSLPAAATAALLNSGEP